MTDKIRVIISNSQKEVKIPTGLRMLVRRCCNAVLRMENFQGAAEVSVTFANNEQIHELNKMHRNVDAPTDVLSFPMGEDGKYDIDPAERFGHTLQREVGYLTAHSMLHLLGYDHEEPLEKVHMREKEELVMTQLGLPSTTSYVLNSDEE